MPPSDNSKANFSQALQEDLKQRINPEKSRKFNETDFIRNLAIIQDIFARPEFRTDGLRISIVGSNGKGSTAHYLSEIFKNALIQQREPTAGPKTGLYTSPHLKVVNERIKIDGKPISDRSLYEALQELKKYSESDHFSFFEILTLAAGLLLRNIPLQIYEAGLGGRLDAVSALKAPVTILTTISLEHTALLGNNRLAILEEKLGILGPHSRFLFTEAESKNSPNAFPEETIKELATNNSPDIQIYFFTPENKTYLEKNFAFARFILSTLTEINPGFMTSGNNQKNIEIDSIDFQNCQFADISPPPGRMEEKSIAGHRFLFDTAHNPQAITELIHSLRLRLPGYFERPGKVSVFLGCLKDRDISVLRQIFYDSGIFDVTILTGPELISAPGKSLPLDTVKEYFQTLIQQNSINSETEKNDHLFIMTGTHRLYHYFLEITGQGKKNGV